VELTKKYYIEKSGTVRDKLDKLADKNKLAENEKENADKQKTLILNLRIFRMN
jgi:hypothetical protein